MDRFWNHVNKTDTCWEWKSQTDRDGYGRFQIEGKAWQAHRFSVTLDGRDPIGKVVMHTCDNPACVRPDHLHVATQADNIKDMIAKGRYVKPQSKLSDADIADIRSSELSLKKIGTKYNISTCYASNIRNYKVGR